MDASAGPVDEIGPWSEIKLHIVREYAAAYSTVLTAQHTPEFHHIYVDAFAGAGLHLSRHTGEFVLGSPLNALLVRPPFREYHFIDLDSARAAQLRALVAEHENCYVHARDCNQVLLEEVLPRCRWGDRHRALWLLDPYSYNYHWRVVEAAGREQSVEVFLNFPIMAINRTVGQRDQSQVTEESKSRMTAFWGDDSWHKVVHSALGTLFEEFLRKASGQSIVNAYRARLQSIARFAHVSEALPMRNTKGGVVYYLVFASQKPVANKIVRDIFAKHRGRGVSAHPPK